jgi:hypothetical protein
MRLATATRITLLLFMLLQMSARRLQNLNLLVTSAACSICSCLRIMLNAVPFRSPHAAAMDAFSCDTSAKAFTLIGQLLLLYSVSAAATAAVEFE